MAVVLAATGAFLYLRLSATLDEQIDHGLRARADDVAALVRGGGFGLGGGGGRLAEAEETFAQVLRPEGAVLDATPRLGPRSLLSAPELLRASRSTFLADRGSIPGLGEARARVLATPVQSGGETLVVVVGSSLEDRDEALNELLAQLLIGGPLALGLASLLGYGLAAAALRPVEAMRSQAAEISAATSGRRLPVPEGGDEVARLAVTLNDMLARLEAGLVRERRFVAEASHELRTPLALLKTELELALRRPRSPEELAAALVSAAEETDRLVLLADDLLTLARSDEGKLAVSRDAVPVRELLETLARRFALRAERAGIALDVDAPPELALVGDRLRLERALSNLLDNALRYGGGAVRLSACRAEGGVELHVTDRGAGLPPEFLPVAFERFTRPDRSRSEPGAGLGLAIADAVARAHGGSAHAANTSLGADLWLALPAGPAPRGPRHGRLTAQDPAWSVSGSNR